jgi:hypothetical protein
MICPRCGVVNAPERSSCTRCSGSLAPPSHRDDRPLPPVMPITRRAELKMGRASAPAPAGAGGSALSPAPNAIAGQGAGQDMGQPGASDLDGVREPLAVGLYLLSTERSTGQPAPPDGALNKSERLAADRPGRLAVGLSRA